MNEQANLKTIVLMEDYHDRVLYGDEQSEEALQNAIDWAFRDRCDTFKANLYADIVTRWESGNWTTRFLDVYRAIEDTLSE